MAPFSDIQLSKSDRLEGLCVPAKPHPEPRAARRRAAWRAALAVPLAIARVARAFGSHCNFFPFDLEQG